MSQTDLLPSTRNSLSALRCLRISSCLMLLMMFLVSGSSMIFLWFFLCANLRALSDNCKIYGLKPDK